MRNSVLSNKVDQYWFEFPKLRLFVTVVVCHESLLLANLNQCCYTIAFNFRVYRFLVGVLPKKIIYS